MKSTVVIEELGDKTKEKVLFIKCKLVFEYVLYDRTTYVQVLVGIPTYWY